MSQNVVKDNSGLILDPIDAEDHAYNIALRLDLSYRLQVELEAVLNQLATVHSVAERAEILEGLLSVSN